MVLRKSIPGQGLKTGDMGTVIHVYKKGEAFEVEFLTLHGDGGDSNFGSFAGSAGSKKRNHSRPFVTSVGANLLSMPPGG